MDSEIELLSIIGEEATDQVIRRLRALQPKAPLPSPAPLTHPFTMEGKKWTRSVMPSIEAPPEPFTMKGKKWTRLVMPSLEVRSGVGKIGVIKDRPETPFKPMFLVVPQGTAKRLVMTDLHLGSIRNLLGSGPLSLERFSSTYWEKMLARGDDLLAIPEVFRFELPVMTPGQQIIMHVKNISDYDETFAAEWIGLTPAR